MKICPARQAYILHTRLLGTHRAFSDKVVPFGQEKVSPRGGPHALFLEAMDKVRSLRRKADDDVDTRESQAILELSADELELTRKIFHRLDPTSVTLQDSRIDPYWNPFAKVEEERQSVQQEFDDYARMVSAAEARQQRIKIRRQLKEFRYGTKPGDGSSGDPYSAAFRKYAGQANPEPPKPHRLDDKYWARTPHEQILGKERITWRDVDIIQQYLAPNGYILPRRTTLLSKMNQRKLMKAVRTAQKMALLPYDWKPFDYQTMPLMDPVQFMADRLVDKWIDLGDQRSRAMLIVMVKKYPHLNYGRYFKYCREHSLSPGAMCTVEEAAEAEAEA